MRSRLVSLVASFSPVKKQISSWAGSEEDLRLLITVNLLLSTFSLTSPPSLITAQLQNLGWSTTSLQAGLTRATALISRGERWLNTVSRITGLLDITSVMCPGISIVLVFLAGSSADNTEEALLLVTTSVLTVFMSQGLNHN